MNKLDVESLNNQELAELLAMLEGINDEIGNIQKLVSENE